MVEVSPEHPAAALSLLPDSMMYAYINLETVSQRPDLQEHVEFQLSHFVTLDEVPFAEELLVSVGADALLLSTPFLTYGWAIILVGDLSRLDDALRMSAEAGAGLSVSVVDTHRDIDIYALLRTKSSGRESEIYLTVLDPGRLAASPDLDVVREVIDRKLDGGQLPKGLAGMVDAWSLGDFLMAFPNESYDNQSEPIKARRIYAFQAELVDGSSSVFRALQRYDDEEQAAAAAAWLQEQDEPRWRKIGWGSSVAIDQWQHRGSTVYGEVTVPDADMPGLVQGN